MYLTNGYKKSVETCRAHRKSGIAKHREENELRNKYPTLLYMPYEVQQGLYVGYTNRMSVALFPPFSIEIGDFVTWVKARNAFLIQGFLPSDAAKIVQGERKSKFYLDFPSRSLNSSCGARLK